MSIVNDVIFNSERSNARAELPPEPTNPRLFGQQVKPVDNRIMRRSAVVGLASSATKDQIITGRAARAPT